MDLVLSQIDSYCAAVVVARGKLVNVLRVLPKKYEEYFSSHYKLLTEYARGPHHSLSCIVQEVDSGYEREVVFIPLGSLMAVVFTEPGQIVCIGVHVQPAPRATMSDWGWEWRGGLVESTAPAAEVPQDSSLPPAQLHLAKPVEWK